MGKDKIPKEIKELVLWRIDAEIPPNHKLSIGGKGTFTKEEIRESVEKEDEIGRLFVDMQMKFIHDLISGKITSTLAQSK